MPTPDPAARAAERIAREWPILDSRIAAIIREEFAALAEGARIGAVVSHALVEDFDAVRVALSLPETATGADVVGEVKRMVARLAAAERVAEETRSYRDAARDRRVLIPAIDAALAAYDAVNAQRKEAPDAR